MQALPGSPPRVLFEDTHLLVVDKPAGLLSQGDVGGEPSLVDWLRVHVGRNYVGLIHRLDRGTSGLLVVGKRTKAAQRLTQSLQDGSLERRYVALLWGSLSAPATWRHHLIKDERKNEVRVARPSEPGAKDAALDVKPLTRGSLPEGPVTLAEFTLQTGRSHQIRVQAAACGHPLVGDVKYGSDRARVLGRPALHSHFVSFPHPMTQERVEIKAPVPEDMKALLKRAGISQP
ncbi:MAG TPA: RluA family pseudouridine synthase [Bdellovibrionota bacterium]|jgi:23S rRNA pseudouridine1911/1915/1917 synthase|nr:RluA family pseudouridine synthase [Bdellovibrionota bacterium]